MTTIALLSIAGASIAALLLLIIRFEIHAFVALMLVSLLVALATGIPLAEIIPTLIAGMGGTLGSVAILVALNILKEGLELVWRSTQGLMDEAAEPEVQATIEATLQGFVQGQPPGALRFDHVSTRRAGQRRFVDMHMHMPADWTLHHAAELRGQVERALMAAVPGLRATIELLPTDVEAHFDDPKDVK